MLKLVDSASLKQLAATCFLCLLAVSAGTAAAADSQTWQDGKEVYTKVCGYCHDAGIEVGPLLGGRQLPPAYINVIVRHGFRAMPAFPASYIDDASLQKVAEYISKLPAAAPQR